MVDTKTAVIDYIRANRQKTYNKRNGVENINFMFKKKHEDSLKYYTVQGRRSEVITKILARNLWARLKSLLKLTSQ